MELYFISCPKIIRQSWRVSLFQNGGTEMPPYVTWQDFLGVCNLTEEQLALDGGESYE